MSLKDAAQYLAAHGRNGDSTLVHMTPREIHGMQQLAESKGGSLTVNPHTGLVEANFLDEIGKIAEIAAPYVAAYYLGPEAAGAFGVSEAAGAGIAAGGTSFAMTGSLEKGLKAGLGAYGAYGLGEAAMGGVDAASNAKAVADAGYTADIASGTPLSEVSSLRAPMSMADTIKAGASGIGKLGTKDLLKYGLGAAAPFLGSGSKSSGTPTATPEGNIRQYYYDPQTHSVKPLPVMSAKDFGNTTFESRVPYLPQSQAANGGLQAAYANGGVTRFDDGGSVPAEPSVQDKVNQWFAQHADATPQNVVDTVKSIGGMTPEIANALAQHYGIGSDAIQNNYQQLSSQGNVNQWFTEHPDASPQQIADAITASGGLTPGYTQAIANRMGTDAGAVKSNYDQLVTQGNVDKWYAEHPNATPQEVANTVQSIGGLNPELTNSLAKHYKITPAEIQSNYRQLTTPTRTATAGGGNRDKDKLINAGLGAAASYYLGPGYDYASGVGNLFSGNYGGAAKDFISGFTGGLSKLFADGGAVRFDDGGAAAAPKFSAEDYANMNTFAIANANDPAKIAAAAQQYGVSAADLAKATNQSVSNVNNYFSNAGINPTNFNAYTSYTPDQLNTYFADPKNDVASALSTYNAKPTDVNNYIGNLIGGYTDPTQTQGGTAGLPAYLNLVRENMNADEIAAALSARDPNWGTGYWNKDTIAHGLDVGNAFQKAGIKTDKDWYNFMKANPNITTKDISYLSGLSFDETEKNWKNLQSMYGPKVTTVTPPRVVTTNGGVSPPAGGTTNTYTGDYTTTPKTYAPTGTTNPYGNTINPGDITRNVDSTLTTHPNVTGRPYGGYTGMGQVRDAYTAGGGRLGQVLTPSKTGYTNTGESAQAYKYLAGEGNYPTQATGIGNNSRYYYSEPSTSNTTSKYWRNPKTGAYEINPNYVDPALATKAAANATSLNTSGDPNQDLGNATAVGGANGGLMAAMARGGSTHQPFFSRSTGKFNYTGAKVYADGGISVGSRPDPNIDGQYQPPSNVPFQTTVGKFASGGEAGYNLGGYSDGGRLLRGPGDGVSDSIPATIGHKQPARLADGEFVVPARIVSELGNGSTEAGARKLYAMMERVQQARGKTVGKGKVAKNSRADKYLPV